MNSGGQHEHFILVWSVKAFYCFRASILAYLLLSPFVAHNIWV